ncbi:MAG: TIGR03987 family protein [Gemmatimonadales bacterium]|nr:MAG: TIGR03987 family protein [Gemmatimonadales bacterium]
MNPLTLAASVLITLALIFYSVGVWAEHLARYLKGWHVRAFWTGFLFDTSGTLAMEFIHPGFDWASAHTISGQIALWLMLTHAIWATRVVRKGSDRVRRHFHRFSLVVWGIWLVPYISGMVLGMTR